MKEHVSKLLERHQTVFGDFTITEYDDPFLTEHVKSVSVCDTDLSLTGSRVS